MKREVWRCANCRLEIAWEPIVVDGQVFCCGGCAQGGPCYCSYDLDFVEPERSRPTVGGEAHRRRARGSRGTSDPAAGELLRMGH